MGDTNISGIGKILAAQQETVAGTEKQNPDIKVSFSDMMTQTGAKSADGLAVNAKNRMVADSAKKSETSAQGPVDDYEKYQYKENFVESKQEPGRIQESNQIAEDVTEYAEAVKDVLKEELGVSDEDIQNAMETLGLSFVDLLNQNNLANLVAELTGVENVSQLLCNEQFLNVLQSVNAFGQELLQDLQLTADELTALWEQMMTTAEDAEVLESTAQSEMLAQSSAAEAVSSTNAVTEQEDATVQADDAKPMDSRMTVTEDTVEVSVEATGQKEDGQAEMDEMLGQQSEAFEKDKANDSEKEPLNIKGLFEDRAAQNANGAETVPVNQNTVLDQLGSVETMQNLPEYVTVRDIIEQIVDTTRVTLTNEVSKIEMQLNPENLGKVYLEITEQEGVLSAKLQVQNFAVKEALEMQLAELRQNLNQTGIRVDEVEVTIASHEFERNLEQDAKGEEQQAEQQQKAIRSRRINLNDLDELSGLMTEEETLVAKMMAEQGNSVDYTA